MKVRLSSRASRDLDNLSKDDFRRVDERITTLSGNPRPHGDILNTPGERIRDLSVSMTVIDGEIVYNSATP